MDSRNENIASSSSGSASQTLKGSRVPGGQQHSTSHPLDTPTPQENEHGPTTALAQREQPLQQVESLADTKCRSRSSPSIYFQSNASGCSREIAMVHHPSTAPAVPQDLMREPLSKEFADCHIELASRRIGVIRAAHSRAVAEGHLFHPVDAARAAAALQLQDLQKAETESIATVSENPRSHPRGLSTGRESITAGTTGTERSSRTVGRRTDAGSMNRSYYTDVDDMPMQYLSFECVGHYLSPVRECYRRYKLAVIWLTAVVGAVLGFVLLGLLIQYIRHRNRGLSTESKAETSTEFTIDYYKHPPYRMPSYLCDGGCS